MKLIAQRRNILVLILALNATLLAAQPSFYEKADAFFKANVYDGMIYYKGIHENPKYLNDLVEMVANHQLEEEWDNDNEAFLINAYNILVIKGVIESYPVKSPLDVSGFFDQIDYEVAGNEYTLNQIENEVLRVKYNDARVHFVLVCGAVSCPPITNFAYVPDKLDRQMEQQTIASINNDQFIRVEKNGQQVLLSEIFKWYREDFVTENSGLIDYVNKYRKEPVPGDYEVSYYQYDWSLNEYNGAKSGSREELKKKDEGEKTLIQTYTPSSLLKEGQFEVQLFNNLYTQTGFRNEDREKIEEGMRSTYFTGLFNILYGISKNRRINVGMDINIKSVRLDEDEDGSPLKVFRFKDSPDSRTALSSFGPKIKFTPGAQLPNFSVQSAFWFPVASDLEGEYDNGTRISPFLAYDMYTFWNQFFYDRLLNDQLQLFLEGDLLFRFRSDESSALNHVVTPVSMFLSYFPMPVFTVYVNGQYAPTFSMENNELNDFFDRTADYAQAGLGFKYQLTGRLNVELSYTNFFTSLNAGAGSTYNVGLRYIH